MIATAIKVEIRVTVEASGPAPKIIGNGTMKSMTPPVGELPVAAETKISTAPIRIMQKPRIRILGNVLSQIV